MDKHSVSERPATAVTIAGIDFNNVFYDREVDVLYLSVRDPKDAVDWGGTAEGDGTQYGPDGSLVGITILNAKLRLEEDGKIEFTLPEHRVEVTDLGAALA